MIRGLLVGIARIIFWVIAFVVISRVVRMLLAPFRARHNPPPSADQPDSQKKIEYNDVQDASFKDLK
jgi:hypothetical protein